MIDKIEINLLPPEYRVRKPGTLNVSRTLVYPIAAFIVLALAAGSYTIYLRDQEATLRTDIEQIEKEIAANKHIQTEMDKLRAEKTVTEQKIRALMRISVNREKWVRLLEILSGNLPSYTWLMSVKEDQAGDKLNIDARSYSFPEVAHYMSKIEQTDYIDKVELTGIEQIQGVGRPVYRFSLVCDLNKNVGLAGVPGDDENAQAKPAAADQQGRRRRGAAKGGN